MKPTYFFDDGVVLLFEVVHVEVVGIRRRKNLNSIIVMSKS